MRSRQSNHSKYLTCARDPVFPRQGKSFDTRSWFHPCLEDAEIIGYVWHSNRHTFCSWLAMAGASIKEIQEAAGHKTITMSARYSHLSPAHNQSVVERIAGTATQQPSQPIGRVHSGMNPRDFCILLKFTR